MILPWWSIVLVVGATYAILFALEARRPLRREVEPKARRNARNLGVAGLSAAVQVVLQGVLLAPLVGRVAAEGWGVLPAFGLPVGAERALAVFLLDYTLWPWHYLNHRVPFLWRFHLVHHVDRDLDASTALRFHFCELALSIGWRALQVVVIGADPVAFSVGQVLLFVSTLFHHSNLRLPIGLERALVRVVVTPRMHGIHHSTRRAETDSNFASLLVLPDLVHRTLRLDVPQDRVEIGVPAWNDPRLVTLGRLLAMPFRAQCDDWAGDPDRESPRPRGPSGPRTLEA